MKQPLVANVNVSELIGEDCLTQSDGEKLRKAITPMLNKAETVRVDFAGVRVLSSPFLNAAIGKLLQEFPPDLLNEHLKIVNVTNAGRALLERVVDNARMFYGDKKVRNAISSIFKKTDQE